MAEATRRTVLAAITGATGMQAVGGRAAQGEAWAFSFPAIEGGSLDLAAFRGRVLLVTNTASFCGYTYQYEALEKLHELRQDEGLTVIGVPSGDFNQESADNETVKTFCDTRFGISFPLAALSHVRGKEAAPFYAWVKASTGWQPAWNFNKVLIGRDGGVLGTYGSGDEPDGVTLSQAISVALGKAAATG
jgi:glutathione peroxidase